MSILLLSASRDSAEFTGRYRRYSRCHISHQTSGRRDPPLSHSNGTTRKRESMPPSGTVEHRYRNEVIGLRSSDLRQLVMNSSN